MRISDWRSDVCSSDLKLEDDSSEFHWTNGSLNIASDKLKIGTGSDNESRLIQGTFGRDTALARDDLQFFAPGHNLVDAMIFEAEHGRHSRLSAFMLEGFAQHRGTLLLQVLAPAVLTEHPWMGHDIATGPA